MAWAAMRKLGGRCKYGHLLHKGNISVIRRPERRNIQIVCKTCRALLSQNYERRKKGLPELPMKRQSFEQWASERKQVW